MCAARPLLLYHTSLVAGVAQLVKQRIQMLFAILAQNAINQYVKRTPAHFLFHRTMVAQPMNVQGK